MAKVNLQSKTNRVYYLQKEGAECLLWWMAETGRVSPEWSL